MTTDTHHQRLLRYARAVAEATTTLDALEANRQLEHALMDARTEDVAAARLANKTWAEIGTALGVSKQAVQSKYGVEPDDDSAGEPPTPCTPGKEHLVIYDREGQIQGYAKKARGPLPFAEPDADAHADATTLDGGDPNAAEATTRSPTRPTTTQVGGRRRRQRELTVVNDA